MGALATDDKQLIYIYSDQSHLGKKVLAYAESSNKPLRTINVEKEKISDTIWLEIADMVNKPLAELFSPDLTDNPGINKALDYNTDDLLKIVNKNPSLLQHPIAINGKKALIINDQFDFIKFIEKDGNNFDKSPEAIKNGEHRDTTADDDMNNVINS